MKIMTNNLKIGDKVKITVVAEYAGTIKGLNSYNYEMFRMKDAEGISRLFKARKTKEHAAEITDA